MEGYGPGSSLTKLLYTASCSRRARVVLKN